MNNLAELPDAVVDIEAEFRGLKELVGELTQSAKASDEGWAFTRGVLTPTQTAFMAAGIDSVFDRPRLLFHDEASPLPGHDFYNTTGTGSSLLLQDQEESVRVVTRAISRGLKSGAHGLPGRFGELVSLHRMEPGITGPGHIDMYRLRWTGNVSIGPTSADLRNDRRQRQVIEDDDSIAAVYCSRFFRGGTWHRFRNSSLTKTRRSASVAIM